MNKSSILEAFVPEVAADVLAALLSNNKRFLYIEQHLQSGNLTQKEATSKNINKATLMAHQFLYAFETMKMTSPAHYTNRIKPAIKYYCALISNDVRYGQISKLVDLGLDNDSATQKNVNMALKIQFQYELAFNGSFSEHEQNKINDYFGEKL